MVKLNKNQAKAVAHIHGPCMVLAGPGSGKTRIISQRIVSMVLDHDIPPTRILAISFTKASSLEMFSPPSTFSAIFLTVILSPFIKSLVQLFKTSVASRKKAV